jgi:hypothetical protein
MEQGRSDVFEGAVFGIGSREPLETWILSQKQVENREN